jgi:hypothetical protein
MMVCDWAECRHCGRPILRQRRDGRGWDAWVHAGGEELRRGCRAASYRPGVGWDETLDRRTVADPLPEPVSADR